MSRFDVRGAGCKTYQHGKCCGNCRHYENHTGRSILDEQRCGKWDEYFCTVFALCDEWEPHEDIADEMPNAEAKPSALKGDNKVNERNDDRLQRIVGNPTHEEIAHITGLTNADRQEWARSKGWTLLNKVSCADARSVLAQVNKIAND